MVKLVSVQNRSSARVAGYLQVVKSINIDASHAFALSLESFAIRIARNFSSVLHSWGAPALERL